MRPDRRVLKVLLAALEMRQDELARRMGYDSGYVANVVNGFTEPSDAFKRAFGDLVADLVIGQSRTSRVSYPAEPLKRLVLRRAAEARSKTQFYADLGISGHGWGNRQRVSAALVDRVCCALGVHPTSIYGRDFEVAS